MDYSSKSMKISELLKLFRESLTLEELEQYKSILSVKNVNSHLENDSFLYQGGTGRRPTLKGKSVGIFEEKHFDEDGNFQYWQVLYNEKGQAFLSDYLNDVILGRKKYEQRTESTDLGNGRDAADSLLNELKDEKIYLIFFKEINAYRIYNKSSVVFCELFGLEPYQNSDGQYGARIALSDFENVIVEELKSLDLGFAIKDKKILHLFTPGKRTLIQPPVKPPAEVSQPVPTLCGPVATLRNYIDLIDLDNNEVLKFYLADAPVTIKQMITRNDGTIEIIDIPVKHLNGYQILSPELILSKEIIGKHESETFEADNWHYKILKIQEELNLDIP